MNQSDGENGRPEHIAVFADTGEGPALPLWGGADCQSNRRLSVVPSGGDQRPTERGGIRETAGFRRLRVLDGDDRNGERCELGLNDRRKSPVALYAEGQHRITSVSLRLPRDFPIDAQTWQLVLQMKQTQPAANSGGTPVLELDAWKGRWILRQSLSRYQVSDSRELWSAPATRDVWARFEFDVIYSQDPAKGTITVRADLDGDGHVDGHSPTFHTFTLKTETDGHREDGIDAGQPIPSHLRVGIYHDPAIECPARRGCQVDIDNVDVVAPDLLSDLLPG